MECIPEGFLENLRQQFQNMKENSTDKQKVLADASDGKTKVENAPGSELSLITSKIDEVLSALKKESTDHLRLLSIKASILYENAKISLTHSQFQEAKDLLENSLNLIKDYAEDEQIAFLYLRVVNYLAYILSRLGKLDTAKDLLEKVMENGMRCNPKVYSTEDLFSNNKVDEDLGKIKIEKLMINNMQMLGWVYGKIGMKDLYAEMQHKCLQKELDLNDGDPVQWAVKCYRLASLFLTECKWVPARYHLTAAQAVLDPLEVGFTPNPLIYRTQAELARVWVNYGLHLFSISKKTCLERKLSDHSDIIDLDNSTSAEEETEPLTFKDLEVVVPHVPAKEITNIQEAKSLFSHTQKWVKRARLYYTLRDYPMQYVNIILEQSELYRLLSFYEEELDAKYGLQKKRYDTLETLSGILKEVRPNCYAAVSLELIREIVEVQIELMNLNLKKLYNPDDDLVLSEHDMKRRRDTLAEIQSKMEYVVIEENQISSEAGDNDIVNDEVTEKEEVIKSDVTVEEVGEGEVKSDEVTT